MSPALALMLACSSPQVDSGQLVNSGMGDPSYPPVVDLAPGQRTRIDAADLGLDTSASVGFGGPGVAIADLDGDGAQDLAWVSPRGWGLLLWGDGQGAFTPGLELPAGIGASAADFDGDADLDLLIVGEGDDKLLVNDGSGSFTEQLLAPGDPRFSHSASWADLDGDGDLDLFVARYLDNLNGKAVLEQGAVGDGNQLFLGDGQGGLVPAEGQLSPEAEQGLSFHGAWLDVDGDGDMDLYVVNDFGPTATENRLLVNDGGQLVDRSQDCGCDLALFGMGVGVGDPDGDGDADLFVTNLGPPVFLANDGSGAYYEAGLATGLQMPDDAEHDASWGAAFTDLDLDGRQDLAVSYGQLNAPGTLMAEWLEEHSEVAFENAAEQPDALLHNRGEDGWEEVATDIGFDERGVSRALATGDLDGDVQPEIVVAGLDYLSIFDPGPTPYDGVVLTLDAGAANRFGLGARVEATIGGRVLTRWMQPTSQGSFTASTAEVFLGLGEEEQIDRLRITWPDSTVTEALDLPAGRHHLSR